MAGLIADLEVAARLALAASWRRLRGKVEAEPDLQEFQSSMQDLIAGVPPALIRSSDWLAVDAQQPPWFDTGLKLKAGEHVSIFIEGRVYANKFLDIWLGPALQLWAKIGEQGEVFRGSRKNHSFCSQDSGALLFGNYFPNDWADKQGRREQDDSVYASVHGELRALVIVWADSAQVGLCALLDQGDYQGRVQNELDRLAAGDTTPPGWQYLWNLGPAEIYRQRNDATGKACIHCHTQQDTGILQYPINLPLLESSTLSWRWCIEQLPSLLREDTVPSHDYLSIAVEFDNGRDITYYWSRNLPTGFGFDCPLPNWKGKEYHVVVRSGEQGLGEWLDQSRNLYQDYQQYMGPAPARIVKVWLIANSVFQRLEGVGQYSDIAITSDDGESKIL